MLPLKDFLPKAKSTVNTNYDHSNDPWFNIRYSLSGAENSEAPKAKWAPPYLKRAEFKPTNPDDFGDGGAFPEIGYAQYPLCMGSSTKRIPSLKTLTLTMDEHGNLTYDSIVRQNENAKSIVYSQYSDLIPVVAKDNEEEEEMDAEEKQKEIEDTTQETKAALEKKLGFRLFSSDSEFIKYKPSQQSATFNSGAKERIVHIVEMPVDALEPPKFKHKRVPKASGSSPVPVMRSPPQPMTVKDQQDWKIPPCISNWKNPKGYTIPLHNRLAADSRVLQEVQINDNFSKLSEGLYVAEQKAREAVAMRSKVEKERMMKKKEKNEMELRELARKARSLKDGVAPAVASERGALNNGDVRVNVHKETEEEREERLNREKIREERRKERERGRMLEAKDAAMGKKTKITRDRGRDISEKLALGMATTGGRGGEVLYDQRLFNQEKGMDSGFANDEAYNIYDKGLFTKSTMGTLHKPNKEMDDEMYGGADDQLENLRKTERFNSGRAFVGTSERTGPRERSVEFEKDQKFEEDIFGLNKFLTDLNAGNKKN